MGGVHSLIQMAEGHQPGPRYGPQKQTIEGWEPVPFTVVSTMSLAFSTYKAFISVG